MLRYARLFMYFVAFSFSKAMEFRVDFWFRVLMDAVFYIVSIAFFEILFLHTPVLGSWQEQQVMVFVASYLLIDALTMTLLSNNLWYFPQFVNRGDLDYYLIRPVSSLFFLSLRDFAANSFLNLLMALGILVWAVLRCEQVFPLYKLLLFGAFLLNGAFLFYSVRMCLLTAVFWTHSARGMDTLFYTLQRFMERPDSIYYGWARKALLTVLPFALMASLPARLLLEAFSWQVLLNITAVTAAFFALLLFLWQRALRAYASASS